MLTEAVQNMLNPSRKRPDGLYDGVYVDCTFGRGGHCREILKRLSPEGRLFAFDVDPEAVRVARQLEAEDKRFQILHHPFGDLAECFVESGTIDGVMVDLGVSSPQLDDRHRGFHISDHIPPDMRMNQFSGMTCQSFLSSVSAEELAWVIHSYGEDDDALLSERIAASIIAHEREERGIHSCRRLADIVKSAKGGYQNDVHPAKLTFQALRVFINQEMVQLAQLMEAALERLVMGGTFSIITFKRKEANAVRKFVRENEDPDSYLGSILSTERLCELFPLLLTEKNFSVEQIYSPLKSSWEEVQRNWRSRSSAVHVLQKRPRTSRVLRATVRPMQERMKEPRVQPTFVGGAERAIADLRPLQPAVAPSAEPAPEPAAAVPKEEGGQLVEIRGRVLADYPLGGPVEGYLSLRRGDIITIYYEGTSGEEVGWSYGVAEAAGEHGWFPSNFIDRLMVDEAG